MSNLYYRLQNYDFQKLFEKLGYAYFTSGNYNLNIIGVRSDNKNKVTNQFDDYFVIIYNTPTKKNVRKIIKGTTEPGLTIMRSPTNKKGAGIVVPGQYRGLWKIALHNGKYKALCQRDKPIKVYRDNNRDSTYDLKPQTIDKGIFGINFHRANERYLATLVNDYSAGCQVVQDNRDFQAVMYLAENQVKAGMGSTFTYTLIREQDL